MYLDVIDASQDLSQRQQMYDRDGLQEEQEERRRRRKANERFRQFAKIVTELVDKNDPDNTFEFDFPEDRLMFTGVPNKTGVNIYPTGSSFISLEDNPPFVLALDEVELAYFERVQLSLKNFDLVFVYKDLDRPVVKIRSIPTQSLDSIQSYLTEMGVMYYVGPMNLQWPRILKVVKDDPKSFYEDGGWEVVLGENDEDEEGVESESEYEESEDEASMEEDTDEYESDAGSDEEDGDEEFDEEDDEEEGLDWDELEERAIQEDKKRRRSDDEDERPRSSKNRRR